MADTQKSALDLIEIIKASGPYIVAVASTIFAYLQSRKASSTQEKIAETNKEKDLLLVQMQNAHASAKDNHQRNQTTIYRLQEIYSPLYAKLLATAHIYQGLTTEVRAADKIKVDLEKFVADDYMALSIEYRKSVLAEAIALCQMLDDHKAYEIAVSLDNSATEALSLFDFSGKSCGADFTSKFQSALRNLSLLYVSFFYRVVNQQKSS